MTEFFDETGGIRKMRIGNKDAEEADPDGRREELEGPHLRRRPGPQARGHDPGAGRAHDGAAGAGAGARASRRRLEISGATFAYEPMYNFHPAEGRFITAEDLAESAKVVVLGSTRREQLFGGRPALGQTVSIGGATYTVVGVMEKKEFYWNSANDNALEWMNEFVFVPITTMLNRMSGDRTARRRSPTSTSRSGTSRRWTRPWTRSTAILRRTHGGVEDFEVFNRADRMRQMEEQGKIYDVTFLVCGTISLLVGGIVIMNILLASFNERVREVGTRKALGATGLNIMAQFLVESVVVTICRRPPGRRPGRAASPG